MTMFGSKCPFCRALELKRKNGLLAEEWRRCSQVPMRNSLVRFRYGKEWRYGRIDSNAMQNSEEETCVQVVLIGSSAQHATVPILDLFIDRRIIE